MSIMTVTAPMHVTILRSWGYYEGVENIPLNDMIAVTLNQSYMCGKATVIASEEFQENRIIFDGVEEPPTNLGLERFINGIKSCSELDLLGSCWLIKAYCENNADKDLGLDTRAAEYAAFAKALAWIYGIDADVSSVLKLAYPTACLSVHGGIVKFYRTLDESNPGVIECLSKPVIGLKHWSDLLVVILVVNDDQPSPAYNEEELLSQSDYAIKKAGKVTSTKSIDLWESIFKRKFADFATNVMKESNLMQAIYMTAYPPINYLNDTSREVVKFVHAYNDAAEKIKVGYTFQRNPNPVLFIMQEDLPEFVYVLLLYFHPLAEHLENFYNGMTFEPTETSAVADKIKYMQYNRGGIKKMFITNIDDGPTTVSDL